jgi:hypothetical protein
MDAIRHKFSNVLTSIVNQHRPTIRAYSLPSLDFQSHAMPALQMVLLTGESKVFDLMTHLQCPVNGIIEGAIVITNYRIHFQPIKPSVRCKRDDRRLVRGSL